LCSDLGFTPHDRKENIRRVGEVAKLFSDAGIICVTAFISPYRDDRARVRQMVKAGQFIEVFVNAPIEVCEQRDPKGLYAKARANQLQEFTGVSAPYEPPEKPELELRTDDTNVSACVARILDHLHLRDVETAVSI
jgi:adenylyl-sulfate kinase